MDAAYFSFARFISVVVSFDRAVFAYSLFSQLDEFISRLKETRVGHRHFYEVDSSAAVSPRNAFPS